MRELLRLAHDLLRNIGQTRGFKRSMGDLRKELMSAIMTEKNEVANLHAAIGESYAMIESPSIKIDGRSGELEAKTAPKTTAEKDHRVGGDSGGQRAARTKSTELQ